MGIIQKTCFCFSGSHQRMVLQCYLDSLDCSDGSIGVHFGCGRVYFGGSMCMNMHVYASVDAFVCICYVDWFC